MNDSMQIGGHPMMNHLGLVIHVTQQTIRWFDRRHYLRRDRTTGLFAMKPELFGLWRELELFDIEMGSDMSGPSVCVCHCQRCKEKTERDDANVQDIRTRQIVRDLKAKRKFQ